MAVMNLPRMFESSKNAFDLFMEIRNPDNIGHIEEFNLIL
jgi:hypothetical protein